MKTPFYNLDNQQKQLLIKDLEGTTQHFETGVSLTSFFKLSYILGIVMEGEVKISRTDYSGAKYLISLLPEDSVFGPKIFPMLTNEYDIETTEPSTILILDYRVITKVYGQHSDIHQQFKANLLEIVTELINDANERIAIISRRSIRDKLIEYFEYSYRKSLSRNIYLPFSYKDLADYLAVDRSAMTREIKHLKDEGFIETRGRKIVLLYK